MSKIKTLFFLWSIILLSIFFPGCSNPVIIVLDSNGNPVEGAVVIGTSLSISSQRTTTDINGYADIPKAVQPTKWISVQKPGYITVSGIDVNQKKPITIILKRK